MLIATLVSKSIISVLPRVRRIKKLYYFIKAIILYKTRGYFTRNNYNPCEWERTKYTYKRIFHHQMEDQKKSLTFSIAGLSKKPLLLIAM